ncbi:urease accessory protein UreF [Nitriliruptoraceae bacterium ZYF776]|nr:urease accessory protein UreF [Profundirhabdus halotolerans]
MAPGPADPLPAADARATFALLLLGDGRFPSGAHAHSLGIEAAVAAGLVDDLDGLQRWIDGHLHTTWRLDAAVAVHAHRLVGAGAPPAAFDHLDVEVTARTTSPELRAASRQLGRQLLRAASRTWPAPALAALGGRHPDGPHVAVVQGVAAAVAGLSAADAATVVLHGAVQLASSAALRLLGLDPYAIVAAVADLAPALAAVVAEVVAAAGGDAADLPAAGAPRTDLLLAVHATADGRLFTS